MGARKRSGPAPATVVALGVGAGLFAGQLTSSWKEGPNDWRFQVLLPLLAAGVIGLIILAGGFALQKVRRRSGATPGLVLSAAATGLLAAAPVGLEWNDGCNSHDGRVPLFAAPVTALSEPEKARVSYDETMTLVACLELPAGALPVQPG